MEYSENSSAHNEKPSLISAAGPVEFGQERDKCEIEQTVARHLCDELDGAKISHLENHLKYAADSLDACEEQKRVFGLMRAINERAVNSSILLSDGNGRSSFSETLQKTASTLAQYLAGRKVCYIELGPEPIKTERLIAPLSKVADVSYVGIDINKNSEECMFDMLKGHLPESKIKYLVGDYHDESLQIDTGGADVQIITMMGFQEGNEAPGCIGKVLDRIGSLGETVLLSEHQLYDEKDDSHIHGFYQSAEMLEFSRSVVRMCGLRSDGEYSVYLVPAKIGSDNLNVAVTLLDITPHDSHVEDQKTYMITNVNVKPLPEQLAYLRKKHTNFSEKSRFVVGDRSVAFQISADHEINI